MIIEPINGVCVAFFQVFALLRYAPTLGLPAITRPMMR